MHPAEACSGLTLPYTGQHREHDGKRQKWAMCDDKAQYEMSKHLQLLYHQSVLENATGGRWCPTVLYLVSRLRNSAMAVTMESNDSSEKDHGFGGRKKSDVFYCSVQIFRAARSQTGGVPDPRNSQGSSGNGYRAHPRLHRCLEAVRTLIVLPTTGRDPIKVDNQGFAV